MPPLSLRILSKLQPDEAGLLRDLVSEYQRCTNFAVETVKRTKKVGLSATRLLVAMTQFASDNLEEYREVLRSKYDIRRVREGDLNKYLLEKAKKDALRNTHAM